MKTEHEEIVMFDKILAFVDYSSPTYLPQWPLTTTSSSDKTIASFLKGKANTSSTKATNTDDHNFLYILRCYKFARKCIQNLSFLKNFLSPAFEF